MKLDTKLVAEVADAAETTIRTVERRMLGLSIRGARLQARIDRELAARGIAPGQVDVATRSTAKTDVAA